MKLIRTALAAILMCVAVPAVAEPMVTQISAPQVNLVVLYKSTRQLVLFNDQTPIRTYKVKLGNQPVGDKQQSGDGRTPEGTYFIDRRNGNSAYHLSLGISYPNEQDRAEAEAMGVDPGGDIFIHGGPTRFWDRFKRDWTAGCIAVSDRDIEEIWSLVQIGTPIVIVP